MRQTTLVAAVIATITLVGCGSTGTVTQGSSGFTTASSSSASSEGMGGASSAVAACLRAAGAAVRGPQAAAKGLAVYATTRDGAEVGFVKAPDVSNIQAIGKVFTQAGDHITMLHQDPTAFTFYKRWTTSMDSGLLRRCSVGTTAAPSSGASSEGKPVGPTGLNPSAFRACVTTGGVRVIRTLSAGAGTEVYAISNDGAVVGVIKGPTTAVARDIAQSFSRGGYTTKPVKKDSTAYAIYKGRLSRADSGLLSQCTR